MPRSEMMSSRMATAMMPSTTRADLVRRRLGRSVGARIGPNPNRALGLGGGGDEHATAPLVRRGIQLPGRELLALRCRSGEGVVVTVGTRHLVVDHPAQADALGCGCERTADERRRRVVAGHLFDLLHLPLAVAGAEPVRDGRVRAGVVGAVSGFA